MGFYFRSFLACHEYEKRTLTHRTDMVIVSLPFQSTIINPGAAIAVIDPFIKTRDVPVVDPLSWPQWWHKPQLLDTPSPFNAENAKFYDGNAFGGGAAAGGTQNAVVFMVQGGASQLSLLIHSYHWLSGVSTRNPSYCVGWSMRIIRMIWERWSIWNDYRPDNSDKMGLWE